MEANLTCTADEAFKAALTKNGKTGPYIMGSLIVGFVVVFHILILSSCLSLAIQGHEQRRFL